jgi:hypothetical protein
MVEFDKTTKISHNRIMTCKYTYRIGDRLTEGKYPGGRCGARVMKGYEYCAGHVRSLGLLPPGKEKAMRKKASMSAKERHDREREIDSAINDLSPVEGCDILSDYDLSAACGVHRKDNVLWKRDSFKRSLFVLWFVADREKRKPQGWREAARLLDVKHQDVLNWVNDSGWDRLITESVRSFFVRQLPDVARAMVARLRRGDATATTEIAKLLRSVSNTPSRTSLFTRRDVDMAREYNKSNDGAVGDYDFDFVVDRVGDGAVLPPVEGSDSGNELWQ